MVDKISRNQGAPLQPEPAAKANPKLKQLSTKTSEAVGPLFSRAGATPATSVDLKNHTFKIELKRP